jgi:hypothetical protein
MIRPGGGNELDNRSIVRSIFRKHDKAFSLNWERSLSTAAHHKPCPFSACKDAILDRISSGNNANHMLSEESSGIGEKDLVESVVESLLIISFSKRANLARSGCKDLHFERAHSAGLCCSS